MQLKTILNRVENFKSFVYGKVKWVDAETRSEELVDGGLDRLAAIENGGENRRAQSLWDIGGV